VTSAHGVERGVRESEDDEGATTTLGFRKIGDPTRRPPWNGSARDCRRPLGYDSPGATRRYLAEVGTEGAVRRKGAHENSLG